MVKMFEYGDGDELDFTPSETSKLASLFGSSIPEVPSSTNLMYTSPKQPSLPIIPQNEERTEVDDSKQQITEVLIVKVVSLWKLEDKTYKSLGRHGLGLIGSADSKVQELIAYKTKQIILLRAKITDKFLFFVQKDKFSSFYDNNSENWLVKFESDDQKEFIEKIKSYGAKIVDSTKESAQLLKVKSEPESPILPPKLENVGIGDQESDGSEKRINILNRITKLGKQVVPKPVSTGSDYSDIEGEVTKTKKQKKPKKAEKPKSPVYEVSHPIQQTYPGNQIAVPSMSMVQIPVSYPSSDFSSYLLTQNNELKYTLSSISAKLDALNIPKVCNDNGALTSKVKALELKTENLESTVENYRKKYADLEHKHVELLEKENNNLTNHNLLINKLESEVTALKLALNVKTEQVEHLKKHKESLEKKKIKEYEDTIRQHKERLEDLEQFYNEHNTDAISSLNAVVEDLNQRLKVYEDKYTKSELERDHMRRRHNDKIQSIGNLIKLYMNGMYHKILTNYNEEYSYTYHEIKTILAENLKSATYNLIEEITDRILNEDDVDE